MKFAVSIQQLLNASKKTWVIFSLVFFSQVAFAAVLAVASAQLSAFGPFRQELRPSAPAPRPQAAVSGRVASSDQAASIIRYDNDVGPDGSYSYA